MRPIASRAIGGAEVREIGELRELTEVPRSHLLP